MIVITRRSLLNLLACLSVGLVAVGSHAHSYKLGDIQIGHCWAFASAAGIKETKGFLPLALSADAKKSVMLEKIESPFAGKVEIRRMLADGKFETLPGLKLEPGRSIAMRANALHLAFLDLNKEFHDKERLTAHLTFSDGQAIDVDFLIENPPPHS